MSFIRANFPEETKKKFQEIVKKKGETEAALCRRAILNFIKAESEPRMIKPIKDYGGRS